ncbi:methyltransferase domain-containing protein [Streptomyces sp. NPDC127091]|uniref:methyltransferase domain-containing protein n=1 Tax=Streptomyces sp. NPDC127091 TaxID=3347134 RepID=UPI00364639F3
MFTTQNEGDRGYGEGRRYRPLTDAERSLLAARVPPAAEGRALDVGCGTGELAAHLSSAGYTVDAVDRSETALAEAGSRHGGAARWLRLDIEEDDGAALYGDGYDLITLRFVAPFLSSRDHTLDALGRRLRPGGTLVIITPLPVETPAEQRGIAALAEDELARLQSRWAAAERHDADGLVFLVLRGPRQDETAPHVAAQHTPSSARNGEGDVPRRRHHFHLLGRYYAQVESGRKTIEVRVATPRRRPSKSGTPSSSATGTATGNSTSSCSGSPRTARSRTCSARRTPPVSTRTAGARNCSSASAASIRRPRRRSAPSPSSSTTVPHGRAVPCR